MRWKIASINFFSDPELSSDNAEAKLERRMTESRIDKDVIRALAELLDETNLTEIEIEQEGFRLRVARQASAVAMPSVAVPAAAPAGQIGAAAGGAQTEEAGAHPGTVTSPMVGTVYIAPEPGAAPFVKLGDNVTVGQTLFIVEAMKTMNPIIADKPGKITQILIQDGQPVEFGEPLAIID